jgi:VanZ family protein
MTEPRATLPTKLGSLVSRSDLAWLGAGLMAAAIAILSLTPRPEQIVDVKIWDKLGHFIAYGTLAFVFAHALRRTRQRGAAMVMIAILGSSAFGGLMELLQRLVPPRSPDVLDAVANTIGACLGTIIFVALSHGWQWLRARWTRSAEATAP